MALLLALSTLLSVVSAHGHVTGIVADGKYYPGWSGENQWINPLPLTAGWQADVLDNGFIAPSAFAQPDIICHKSAKNANAYVTAKPGSKIVFQWNTWPVSHKGPVLDYLAPCNGECLTVDKTKLAFSKIGEGAWKSGDQWATDDLIKSNISWTTTVPANLAPGNYVWRHEIIALHAAGSPNGAQAYPQCISFKIEGTGTKALSGGVPATSFYKSTDAGIVFDLYKTTTSYTIPGPPLVKLAKRHVRDWFH